LFYTTGLAFQVPIFQIVIGVLGVISGKQMLEYWKYVVLIATIIGAVLTPSTDPITQLLLSGVIILLYLLGVSILRLMKK
jgi:sec-independent protein translocase protein TatC